MKTMKKGLVQVYTGNGKGKTTAAIGQAIRALGQDYKVCLIQFFKKPTSGEIKILKNLLSIKLHPHLSPPPLRGRIEEGGNSYTIKLLHPLPLYPEEKNRNLLKRKIKDILPKISEIVKSKGYDLVILDEILIVLRDNLLAEEEILNLLKNKPASVELILTGRGASNKVLEAANLVTEMKEVKHPWRRGVRARKGIEY